MCLGTDNAAHLCRYAGLVKCHGCKKDRDRILEVHGDFKPLVAGQKLPKASLLLYSAVLSSSPAMSDSLGLT